MTIPKITPYSGGVANPDGSQTQTEFTQNMFDQLSYEATLADELNNTVNEMNSVAVQVDNDATVASQSAAAAEAAASGLNYQGLWPDSGGSANKGDTYQTQVGGAPTGEYYTALQNTSVDPVGDNVNWRSVISSDLGGVIGGTQFKHRRGTNAEILAGTPALGELWFNTTDNTIHIGDGVTQGGYPLVSKAALPSEPKNIEQDGRLDALETSDASQGARITTNETDIAALQSGQGSGVFGYATLVDINADLTPADGSIGYVTNDPTVTNNGTYRKTGGSGTGGWIQSSNDLASQAYTQSIYNSNRVHTSFDALNSVEVSGDATLDDYTKQSIISSGTPNTETILYNVRFDDVVGVINNAIEKSVYTYQIATEFACTSQLNLRLVKISNIETVETSYTINDSEQEILDITFAPGEIITALYLYVRYSGTAPTNLSTRVKYCQIISGNDATNARLKQAYDRVIFEDNFYDGKSLINQNQYQVSHKADISTIGLAQTYRGVNITGGNSIPVNKTYIGVYLPRNWEYLNGESFNVTYIVRVTGELTASELYAGTWSDLGSDLYARTREVVDFDYNNSSKIFYFDWNKAVSPVGDVDVEFIDLYISIDGDDKLKLITDKQLTTQNDPTLIYATTEPNNGVYGNEYVNLLTAMHSLTDGSETNQYDIILTGGKFDISEMLDYTNIVDQEPYKRGLELSPWVNMLGEYNTEVNCKFTEAFAVANQDVAQAVSPLNFLGNNKLRNIISYAENCRYAVHDDGNTVNDCIVDTENCHFEHLGNAPAVSWQSTQAYGSGFPSGKVGTFKNTKIISVTDAITIHTSQAQNRPFIARFFGCDLVSKGEGASLGMKETTGYSPKMVNTFELHGCTLGGKITSENKNNPDSFNLVGGGNTVVPVETVDGVRQVNLLGGQGVKKVLTEAASTLDLLAHSGSGKVRLFTPSDNINLFAGFAQGTGSTGDLIAVQDGGYIADSDMGITLVVGDTVAIDSGVIVKNGTDTIAVCDYDGFAKLI